MAGKVGLVGGVFKCQFEKIEVNRLCWTIQAQERLGKLRQIVLTWADGGAMHLFVS